MSTILGKRKKSTTAAPAAKVAKTTKATITKSKEAKAAKAKAKAAPAAVAPEADDSNDAIQDIFRRHFEAQFKPLDTVKEKKKDKKSKKSKARGDDDDETAQDGKTVLIRENESDDDEEEEEEDDEEDEDWSGLSGDEQEPAKPAAPAAPAIQVIDYSSTEPRDDPATKMSKHERKLYTSSKVPSSFDEVARKTQAKKDDTEKTYKDAPEMLADDLALQRLISESHLLSGAFALPSSFSTSAGAAATFGAAGNTTSKHAAPFAAGRLRQRTTDLRIQAVANKAKGDAPNQTGLVTVSNAKESIFTQHKMPMSMRKGIVAAAAARETKRRQEAKESGIVLERPQASLGKKAAKRQRQRAVDAPAVGVMRGSELKLRDKDIRAIEGPKKTFRGGKGGKRR